MTTRMSHVQSPRAMSWPTLRAIVFPPWFAREAHNWRTQLVNLGAVASVIEMSKTGGVAYLAHIGGLFWTRLRHGYSKGGQRNRTAITVESCFNLCLIAGITKETKAAERGWKMKDKIIVRNLAFPLQHC